MEDTPDPPSTAFDGTESLYRSNSPGTDKAADGDGPSAAAARVADGARHVVRTAAATPASVASRVSARTRVAHADRIARVIGPVAAFASGSPLVATVAAVETLIATVLLGVPLTPAPAVVALVTFAVYTVDHVADADADARSTPERATLARRYADQLMIAATLAYGLAVALAVFGGPLALAVALLPGVFWVLYASDWLPNVGRLATDSVSGFVPSGNLDGIRRRIPRLKDVLVLNSAVVALGWAVAVTALPLAFAGSGAGAVGGFDAARDATVGGAPLVAVAFGYFFLRSFVDTELPNVRDVEADTAVGVATLPVVLGVVATRRVLYGVDIATAALLAAAAAGGLVAWPIAGALVAGIALSLGITGLAGRIENRSLLGIAPDCSYLVVGVLLAGVHLIG
jgi:1,4-dihydroxy-2-naphthoate octaprenyltransferase